MVRFFTDACVLGPKKIVWTFRRFIHNIPIHSVPSSSAMKNMASICKSCFSSKSRLAQHRQFLLQKRALERCSACYKIEFAINSAYHWRHTFSTLRQLKKYLEETKNMKQDRRLHIKNLIMNDPETVKVTSNETAFFPHNYANDILGNLAWCTMSAPPPPPVPYV